jgi:hypothetical protein
MSCSDKNRDEILNMEPPRRRKPYKGVPYLQNSQNQRNSVENRTETYLFREKVQPKANRNQTLMIIPS